MQELIERLKTLRRRTDFTPAQANAGILAALDEAAATLTAQAEEIRALREESREHFENRQAAEAKALFDLRRAQSAEEKLRQLAALFREHLDAAEAIAQAAIAEGAKP